MTLPSQPLSAIVLGIISILMSALAIGAVWCAAAAWGGIRSSWFILPAGIALVQIIRVQRLVQYAWSPALLVVSILLTYFYAQYLFAIIRIANLMGIPFKNTLLNISLDMACDLIWINFHLTDLVWITLSMTLSLLWIWHLIMADPARLSHHR